MSHHLAQINIAKFRLPMVDPVNAEFIGALDRVNAIAEAQPGPTHAAFIFRHPFPPPGLDAVEPIRDKCA